MIQAFFWSAFAVTPFNAVYLTERNAPSLTIGFVMSVSALVSLLAQPLWGWMSDRIGSSKKVLLLCLCCSSACYLLQSFYWPLAGVCALMIADTFFRCAAVSLLDVWILTSLGGKSESGYGSVRLWGSIGFAAAVSALGALAGAHGVRFIFPVFALLMAPVVAVGSRLPGGGPAGKQQPRVSRKALATLLKSFPFAAFLGFMFLYSLPGGPMGAFLPTLVKSVGGTWAQFGWMQAVKALTEIPFFLFGKRLMDRYGPKRLLVAAVCVSALQAAAYALSGGVLQIGLSLLLSGPSYSLLTMATLYYIYSLAPEGMKATAQILAGSVAGNISSVAGNAGGGFLLQHLPLRGLYWAGGCIIAAAGVFYASVSAAGAKRELARQTWREQ